MITHYKFFSIALLSAVTLCGPVSAQQSVQIDMERKVDSLLLLNKDKEAVANILEENGRLFREKAAYGKAQAAFMMSLKLREEINSPLIALSHLYLGSVAGLREENSLSISHFRKAVSLTEGYDSLRLGQAYNNLGLEFGNAGEYDSSLRYLEKALEVKRRIGSSNIDISATLNNLGMMYDGLENPDSALMYYREALLLRKKENNQSLLAQSMNNVGYGYLINNDLDSASYYLTRSLHLAERDSLVSLLRPIYLNMYRLYSATDNDSSDYFIQRHLEIMEQIYDAQTTRIIQELRAEYDLEKKDIKLAENELALERQYAEKRLYIIIGSTIVVFLTGLLIFLIYRQRLQDQLRKKDVALHNQHVNELIRNQEISVLSARVEGQDTERQRIAEDLHDRLGSKLAAVKLYYDAAQERQDENTVKTARKLLDETIDETRKIAHNLASGVLTRFGLVAAISNLKETLENSKQVDIEFIAHNFENHELSKDLEVNFYRIIQELLSNILKHARAKHISIQLTRHEDGMITLIVEDDGQGFNPSQVSLNSMGLINLQNRVKRFDGVLTIDSEPGHGTTVIIEIEEKQTVS